MEQLSNFIRIQNELKQQLITENDSLSVNSLARIGGLDISFHITNQNTACVSLVVLDFPTLNVVHEDNSLVEMEQPYQSGFLGFREVPFFQKMLKRCLKNEVDKFPSVVLVDGNGILHRNGFGSASHLGVVCDVPSIGVAKNLSIIEEKGIFRDDEHKRKIQGLRGKGDSFPIKTNTGYVIGMAVLTGERASKPVYVSVGHNCSLKAAEDIVLKCSKHRVPEPIRQADICSRRFLREMFPDDYSMKSNGPNSSLKSGFARSKE